ncbi:amino acid adenylation domain-containing protein [uncultured Selenomonas sp.]|uniref:amino acid adenylation domain-containing protein n=1 Tax=uncultured Selenomonas sp. TaxID=159275 RepID=UPI0028F0E3B9|nr:amino acid adenylation domain-containing protein [uncultured Selenomonas sp.]
MLTNVTQYLQYSATRCPDKIAFRDAARQLTFSQLARQSRALACAIAAAVGGQTCRPVAVYLPKGVDCIIAFFAAAYSGNFYTPLDTAMPQGRLRSIMDTLHPAVVLTDRIHHEAALEVAGDALVMDLEELCVGTVDDGVLDKIRRTVIDTDPLYVMFTSGSTGIPKGVVVSHRSVIDYTEWLAETFAFSERTVFGNQAPFYFDNSILDIYSTVKNAGKMVIIPEEKFLSSKRLCRYLDEVGINTIFWVPSALVLVANSGVLDTVCPKGIEKILFCGEVMPTAQLNVWRRALPNALYANLYGPTEITDVCTYFIVEREFSDVESLPIGFPCRNTDILVLNERDEPAADGEIGELCVRGTCLSHGYYRNPEKTAAAFTQNPLNTMYPEKIYRTGDLVRYNQYGELLYLGRKDYQIKHMGHRIELGEIETAASAYWDVKQSCALYDAQKQRIILFVAAEGIDKTALYQHLKTRLPHYMLPALIVDLEALPLNANGKIDRIELGGAYCG